MVAANLDGLAGFFPASLKAGQAVFKVVLLCCSRVGWRKLYHKDQISDLYSCITTPSLCVTKVCWGHKNEGQPIFQEYWRGGRGFFGCQCRALGP